MAIYENYETTVYENLRQMYHAGAERYGEKILFLEKRDDVYEGVSFAAYSDDVDALGTALCARGLHGKRILITGENCYAWVVSYMAVICGVGVVVPVDKEIPAEEIANIARISGAAAVIHSPKCAPKLEGIDPAVERISFEALDGLIRAGRTLLEKGDRRYLDSVIDANAMSALLFTSGTTGVSKGVMLSHRNLCFNLSEMCQMIHIDHKDVFLSVLPLHHAYECTCGFLCPVYRGSTVAFSEGLRYITRNMQEVKPTVILCVPLLLETMYHKVWANIRKKGLENKVRSVIRLTNALPTEGMRLSAKRKLFAEIHRTFGGKLRMMISGGAAVDPQILQGLRDLGIYAYQGYGLTECAPLAALNRDRFYNDASAGLATPNALLDIVDMQEDGTGEVRYKGDNVMLGYFEQPELTAEVLRDGWFYTGDLGYMDEHGFLFLTGRKKNVIVTAKGKNIFPEELETYLGRTPFVQESVVVGYLNPKKKDYDIVALIYPDREQLEASFGPAVTRQQIEDTMKRAICEVNSIVQSYKRIETFVLWEEEFPKNTSKKIKRAGLADLAYAAYLERMGE
ncbi:MAG: AMP-binding protein [Clostridia bacterium]|nr:AMP-binding protein [Clostridia bacterium]